MVMVNYSLSLSDLLLVDGFKEAFATWDTDEIDRILFENGMDVSQFYDKVFCQHRNLRNTVVSCIRFEGYEREDKDWLGGPYASLEAHIAACPDASKRVHLAMLNPRGSVDNLWEDE